jgi:hypothetical protein
MKFKLLAIITAFCVLCFFGSAQACKKKSKDQTPAPKADKKEKSTPGTGGNDVQSDEESTGKTQDGGATGTDGEGDEQGEGSKWGEDFCDSFADKYIFPEYCGVFDEE